MARFRNSDPRPDMGRPKHIDWDRPPWNRWAFQHIREILPTAEVWRGDGPVWTFGARPLDIGGLKVASSTGQPTTLDGLLDETYTDGFLVIHRGDIVYERYFNEMTPRSLHIAQSVSKSVVGALAGVFVGAGKLDPTKLVTDYLPELGVTAWNGATVQQVLDMTTGVVFSEEYTDPYSEVGQVDVASGWKPIPPGADPSFSWAPDVWQLILRLKKTERPHGEKFVYRSIETDVLAFILERISGQRLPELVSQHIWQKLGCEESANFTVDPAGYGLGEGGFNATLRDFGRFGQMMLRGGSGIVPESWIAETRHGAVYGNFDVNPDDPTFVGGYHNKFWHESPDTKMIMCLGVFGQMIAIDYATELVVVKLSSWPDFLNTAHSNATLAAVHAIGRALA
jgi:CubicO group peptidase (beta-lactamase class C family)